MIEWVETTCDLYGTPRYICHYSELLTDAERHTFTFRPKYSIAAARARKIGGRKFNKKRIVFASYNLSETERAIEEVRK